MRLRLSPFKPRVMPEAVAPFRRCVTNRIHSEVAAHLSRGTAHTSFQIIFVRAPQSILGAHLNRYGAHLNQSTWRAPHSKQDSSCVVWCDSWRDTRIHTTTRAHFRVAMPCWIQGPYTAPRQILKALSYLGNSQGPVVKGSLNNKRRALRFEDDWQS